MRQSFNTTTRNGAGSPQFTTWLRYAPWVTGALFFLLYAATAAPSIVTLFDDSLEFQLVLPTFGIAHPTGYPLYTLLGGLWSRVLFPFGNWAWRINLLSALAAGVTVALVYLLARRLVAPANSTGPANWAGLAAALTFGLGPVWWSQATMAEVYALHNLLLAAILVALMGIEQHKGGAFVRRMAVLCLLVGLGIAHHRTIVLALPGVALYLLWSVPGIWRPRKAWLLYAVFLIAPLLLYFYLPLRATMGVQDLHGSYINTWTGFWDHVLARGYASFFSTSSLTVERTPQDWIALGLAQLGWLGLLWAVAGLGWIASAAVRKGWIALLVVLLANLAFALVYRVGDQEVFLLPVFLCLAVLAGGGVALILRWAQGRWVWLLGLVAIISLVANPGRGPWVNRSQTWSAHDYAVDMAKVEYPPHSQVIGLEGEMTALKYMQQAEGLAAAATPVVADDPELRRTQVAEAMVAGLPTYLTREVDGIADQYSFSGEGPLVRVWPRGQAVVPAPQQTLAISMANGQINLEGYELQWLNWASGPALRVALTWRPTQPLAQTLKVSLRLLDERGSPYTGSDGAPIVLDEFPLRQVAPTTSWVSNAAVRDVYTLPATASAAAQPATLQVILYDANTVAEVGRIEVSVPAWQPQ